MNIFFTYIFAILLSFFLPKNNEWEYLFNGKNLDGWKIKIKGHKLGDNFNNTFKVKDGTLKVSYENYDSFDDKFGHIFFTNKKYKKVNENADYKRLKSNCDKYTTHIKKIKYSNAFLTFLHSTVLFLHHSYE